MLDNAVIIKGRICNKHDTEENWNKATNFAPLLGETIVYDPDSTHHYPRYKTGIWDGKSTKTADMLVVNLPFANQPDVISEDEIQSLFTKAATAISYEYSDFLIHLIDINTNELTTASITYIDGRTTWGDLVEAYPQYFAINNLEWDKNTGKPYVCFASPYYAQDYITKKVSPINPEDPVYVPCTILDLVEPATLKPMYRCSGAADCPICLEHK